MNKDQVQEVVDKLQVCHDEHVSKGETIAHEHVTVGENGQEVTSITWTELLSVATLAINSFGPAPVGE